jgi:D-sedoheptulose 7-phosphate isomerase
MEFIVNHLKEIISITKKIDKKSIHKIVKIISLTKKKKGRIFFLGLGGSAANCSHAVNDFRKIVQIEAYTPIDNVSELTARANDEGWNYIFSEWLKISKLNSNDLLFIFSVGGGNKKKNISTNLIFAIDYAKKQKAKIVSILGRNDGYAAKESNIALIIPSVNPKKITPHSEAFQSVIWHLLVSHPDLKFNETKWESI